MKRRFVQLDVFADRPGAGNPLAVVLEAEGLDDAAMQAIARWTRLPETTFLLPPTDADVSYRIRIFSPRREVPFAGHPSVGTAHAALDAGLATLRDQLLVQDGSAGRLPLRVDGTGAGRTISVRTPRASLIERADASDPRLRRALASIPLGTLPPALMDGGRRWLIAEVRSEADLRSLQPAWGAISQVAVLTGSMGLCLFARAAAGADYDLAVRALVGAPGQFEDAASGAANATLAAWLALTHSLPGRDGRYVVSQGREVGFDARLQLQVDPDGEVWSGGRACTIVRGHIDW